MGILIIILLVLPLNYMLTPKEKVAQKVMPTYVMVLVKITTSYIANLMITAIGLEIVHYHNYTISRALLSGCGLGRGKQFCIEHMQYLTLCPVMDEYPQVLKCASHIQALNQITCVHVCV